MDCEDAGDATLREGADFTSAEELAALAGEARPRTVERGTAERLAEAIEREVWWLRVTGELPGGLAWDCQPAWRVRLWEHLIDEQQRVAAIERAMTAR